MENFRSVFENMLTTNLISMITADNLHAQTFSFSFFFFFLREHHEAKTTIKHYVFANMSVLIIFH